MKIQVLKRENERVEVMCIETEQRLSFNSSEFDYTVSEGSFYETENIETIPYSISAQRRADIRAYRREEAECGNI